MAVVNREILLPENCPGCLQQGRETPLRNQLGVFATYCLDDKEENKIHTYTDTEALKAEIAMSKVALAKAKRAAVKAKKTDIEDMVAVAVAEPPEEERAAPSVIEATVVTLTDVDCYRLSELLGAQVVSAGDLVGGVFAMKTALSEYRGNAERRELSGQRSVATAAPPPIDIPQRADGGLALQVYIPEPQAKQLIERSVFNNQSASVYVQALIEYQMAGSYFPVDVEAHPAPADYDGLWVVVNAPEVYVGAMVDKAVASGMTPTEYLQNYIYTLIHLELFP